MTKLTKSFAPSLALLPALACGQAGGGDDEVLTDDSEYTSEDSSEGESEESGESGESEESEESTAETGDGDCDEPQLLSRRFELDGLSPGEDEVRLNCSPALDDSGEDLIVNLSGCTDGEGNGHADLTLTLMGGWLTPSLDQDQPISLVYVQQASGEVRERWLVISSEGQFIRPLIAIDAGSLHPQGVELDFGEIELSVDPDTGCSLDPTDCGVTDRMQLLAEYSGDSRTILDASMISDLGAADGGDSVQYEVAVERAWANDRLCEDVLPQQLILGIVAYPNS